MDDDTSCPFVDRALFKRARRCWMCAYFESGYCHALPPSVYIDDGEVCTARPKVSLFDLGCSMFMPGAHDDKTYQISCEDKDDESYYA